MSEDAKQVEQWLRIFIEPGQVTELRALEVQEGNWSKTIAGFFDFEHLDVMASEALRLTKSASGVYFIPNPVNTDLLARCRNRVRQAKKDEQVSDNLILCRKWFLVDADPVRLAGISSTDAEKDLAWDVIQQARRYLGALGITRSVLADSGNGYHLVCRTLCDSTAPIRGMLAVLASLNTDRVTIDQKVFNPARIVKLYGTLSRKGDHTDERPHRRAHVIDEVNHVSGRKR